MKLIIYIFLCISVLSVFADGIEEYPDSLSKPVLRHGRVFLIDSDIYKSINKSDILLENYTDFNTLVYDNLPVNPLALGEAGADNSFALFGASPLSNSYSMNNSILYNHRYNRYNPKKFPVEYFEKAEFLVGSNAIILSDNSSGLYTNFQEIIHNTSTPYTKFWYSQESDQGIYLDGVYSQNFSKNMNFTAGFRSMSSNGNFTNSSFNSWNFRSRWSWFISDFSTVSATYFHSNDRINMNGGVVDSLSENNYSTIDAFIKYNDLKKREFSNSLLLSYSTYLDTLQNSAFSVNLNISHNKYRINSGNENYFYPQDSTSSFIDIVPDLKLSSKYEQKIKSLIFRAGGNVGLYNMQSQYTGKSGTFLDFAAYSMLDIPLTKELHITGGARYSFFLERNSLSFGSRATYKTDKHRLFADFSISEQIPNYFQNVNLKKELNTLFILNYDYTKDETVFSANVFYRNIQNPLVTTVNYFDFADTNTYNSSNDYNIAGLNAKFGKKLFPDIYAEFNAVTNYYFDADNQILPQYFLKLKSYYEYELKRSYMRAGFDFAVIQGHKNYGYEPVNGLFINQNNQSAFSINGLDVFVSMRLGRAYVKATMLNVLGTGYYYVYLYPVKQRNLRFSVSWSFFD
jgi:hypothetical protein